MPNFNERCMEPGAGWTKVGSAKKLAFLALISIAAMALGCRNGQNQVQPEAQVITSLKDVPAVRLNYRYEPDVPPPVEATPASIEERNAAIQSAFDQNRPQEILDRTTLSPDGKRVLAVYHKTADLQSEFRLDMYSPDGHLLRKVTSDTLAVHFPDTIEWAPDSSTVAFVAMIRGMSIGPENTPPNVDDIDKAKDSNTSVAPADNVANTNVASADANNQSDVNSQPTTPEPAANVLAFRTEQIYICNADGDGLKPLTQNEGLIYFYYVWSPDGAMLAALAATAREWQYLQAQADEKGEVFIPLGRPRLVEKTGRERRLDDGLTRVQPVWSPDSSKVACAFDKQVRIYDAAGNSPTQAAIPLRNDLLLSSKAFDDAQQAKVNAVNAESVANANANANANAAPNSNVVTAPATLPDENTLVSFNPIIGLNWLSEDQLYFQTAYVKRMKNDADSAMSYPRWHRLILTPQASVLGK